MILSDDNLNIWYKDYLKKFENVTKYIKRQGGTPMSTKPMSRQEFGIDFISMTYDNPSMSGKNIAQTMAQQELYSKSYTQAKKLAEAEISMSNVTPKDKMKIINEYRMDIRQNIWNGIRQIRSNMKAQGFSNEAITLFISQEVFGSP